MGGHVALRWAGKIEHFWLYVIQRDVVGVACGEKNGSKAENMLFFTVYSHLSRSIRNRKWGGDHAAYWYMKIYNITLLNHVFSLKNTGLSSA